MMNNFNEDKILEFLKNYKEDYKPKIQDELKKPNNLPLVATLLSLAHIDVGNKKQIFDKLIFELEKNHDNQINPTEKRVEKIIGNLVELNLVVKKSYKEALQHDNSINNLIKRKHDFYIYNSSLNNLKRYFESVNYFYLSKLGKELVPFCLKNLNTKEVKMEEQI